MNEIQDQIGRGEYVVDAHAVADAIVRRLIAGREPRILPEGPAPAQ